MEKDPFLYFSDEVISKLYPLCKDSCTLKEFELNCRNSKWQLEFAGCSYNAKVPNTTYSSFFGDPIDKNIEYLYQLYKLDGPEGYDQIACMVYYKYAEALKLGEKCNPVAVSFYDY